MKLKLFLSIIAISLSANSLRAEVINPIKLNKVIEDTSFHGDTTLSNTWLNGISGARGRDVYTGTLDYRLEASTPLYKLGAHTGTLVTRVEGLGFYDENIQDLFQDRLIDIPELFMVDSFKPKDDLAAAIVFGKFAHRRFIDKNEVVRDPFDIGERAFFGQATGHNNLLSMVSENREGDTNNRYLSKMATGSYGFAIALKDTSGKTIFDQWGLKQAFVVARLDDFGDNYYQATDITKNWGENDRIGQFDIGYVYAQNRVLYRVPGTDDTHVFFTTLAQRLGKAAAYTRYGVAFAGLNPTDNTAINNLQIGMTYDLSKKDIIGLEYLTLNSNNPAVFDKSNLFTSYYTHKFNDNFNTNVYLGFGNNAANAVSFGGTDNNWMIGFNVQGVL